MISTSWRASPARAALPAGTTIFHPGAEAARLARFYHERWEIEGALDELKTHLRGRVVLRNRRAPDLAGSPILEVLRQAGFRALIAVPLLREQQVVGMLVIRRKLPLFAALSPSGQGRPA